jgi:hypothetical protein
MESELPTANSYDEIDGCWAGINDTIGLARCESMDVTNDPRFFTSTVMNKRLQAFKSLTLVSGLMFGTALSQCFKIKKDMNFHKWDWDNWVINIAIWEFAGFLLSVVVASMCLLSLYVISHQLFYTIRLTTAGPTGFEQATMFYLTRVIVVWRHLAVACLFNGLTLFIVLVGIQFFVTFYKDAKGKTDEPHEMWISNLDHGSGVSTTIMPGEPHHQLNMVLHSILAYFSLALFVAFTIMLAIVRKQHLAVFTLSYAKAKLMNDPLESAVRHMAARRP